MNCQAKWKNTANAEYGFTLIELVVSMVILGILSVLTYGIVAMNAQTFKIVGDNTTAQWDLRQTLSRIKRDLQMMEPHRIIGTGKLSSKTLAFKTTDGHTLRFRRKANLFERRWDTEGWQVLLKNLQQDPFIYLDKDLNKTTDKKKLDYIHIRLAVLLNGKTVTLNEKVYIRN